MGKYQDFVLTLLRQVMIPATWLSVDEIYSRLNDLKTNTNKKYVQLPTKHSLAQQMCRFYIGDIKVKKFGARNLYCLKIVEEKDIQKVIEIRIEFELENDTWPEDWSETHFENYKEGLASWIQYRISKNVEPEPDDNFELW